VSDDLDGFYDDAPRRPDRSKGEHAYGVANGRYDFPAPPGTVRPSRGYMRCTRKASAFSDQIKLQNWRERLLQMGMREDEGLLFDELAAQGLETMDPAEAKAWLEQHAQKAIDRAGGGAGARRGTARHTMLQVFCEEGYVTGHRTMRLQLESLFEALERHELDVLPGWSERVVCNPQYGIIGTLDLGVSCRQTGQIGILDLKTQRQFWSYLEICGQQEGYDSAPWVWEGPRGPEGSWVPAPAWDLLGVPGGVAPGRRVALLAHMPQAPGPHQIPVEIHEVDLTFGAEVMEQAGRNLELRSRGASVAGGRRVGGLRPVRPIQIQAAAGVAPRAIAQ
jgi:hypothetical protein